MLGQCTDAIRDPRTQFEHQTRHNLNIVAQFGLDASRVKKYEYWQGGLIVSINQGLSFRHVTCTVTRSASGMQIQPGGAI